MKPYHRNPRRITKTRHARLTDTLERLGDLGGIVHNLETDEVIGGNQRMTVFKDGKPTVVEAYDQPDEQGTVGHGFIIWQGKKYAYRQVRWDEQTAAEANIAANLGAGDWDWDALSGWDAGDLQAWGFDGETLTNWQTDIGALRAMLDAEAAPVGEDPGAHVDKAAELQAKWGTATGQLWLLDSGNGYEHRLIVGDCTDAAVVARLMGGEKSALVHADPPYGMGKENEGIANDNLYREKLDAFQMAWWKACRSQVEDNGSVYIWGNAEDLWRLWYCGGLKDSERLTLRNEVVWTKVSSRGMGADAGRSYPVATERALFFMLGEQGFNNNADNYWEGWEGIRSALAADCEKMGWTADDIKRITGVGMFGHWFTKSQWTFIPKEHYEKLQAAAREHDAFKREHDAFKREHDDLKREFYATRAFFDNTHDNMTDVWEFPRVQGEDRHGHATPKPVAMMERAIKSSAPSGTIVLVPFNGTGPELIACERLGRRCRAVEISPAYVAVAIQRWHVMTGGEPVLLP